MLECPFIIAGWKLGMVFESNRGSHSSHRTIIDIIISVFNVLLIKVYRASVLHLICKEKSAFQSVIDMFVFLVD